MKRLVVNGLIAIFFVCTIALLFQRCEKDDEVVPPPTDTLSAGWQKIYVDTSQQFTDIVFVNFQTGFICGQKYLARSNDGGLSWTKYNLPDSMLGDFENIYFKDANNGWIVSRDLLLRTTNGGTTWQRTVLAELGRDVQFLTPLVGFLVGDYGIYKSINGGVSWQKIPGSNRPEYAGLFFFDENNGWVCGYHHIQETKNGGGSFTNRREFDYGTYYIIQFTDASHGWTTGSTNEVWRTLNAGASWEKLRSAFLQSDVHFFNNNEGYISDDKNIFQTSDGGTTLNRVVYSPEAQIVEIYFTDPNHGWAASNGYIFRYSK